MPLYWNWGPVEPITLLPAEFGRSTLNVEDINRGKPKLGDRWSTAP